MSDVRTGITASKIVHGEQSSRLHRPLTPSGTVVARSAVRAVIDKGRNRGALVVIELPPASGHFSIKQRTLCCAARPTSNRTSHSRGLCQAPRNTLFSHVLAAGSTEGHPLDVFIAGEDAQAKASVSAFIESLGLRPMDTGALPMAWTLEHVCLLSLGLLTHAIKHTNVSIDVSLLG